jgi:hypothetical protein
MATREELVAGLEMVVAQAKRTTLLFAPGEWDWKRAGGWTPKEHYSHLATVAGMIPGFSAAMTNAPEEREMTEGMNIDQMNAQAVGAMAAMTPEQVMQTFEANYGKLIEFVKSMPDGQLSAKRRFLSDPIPVSDILANVAVVHAVHHVYEAYMRAGASL